MSVRKFVLDAVAMSSVNLVRVCAQLLVVPVIARYLSPTDYGLVGLAMPFVLFAMILADAGIGMSLISTPKSNRAEWSTCFWLSVALGLGLAGIITILAPLASAVYSQPRLTPMIMTLALVILAQAIATVPGAMLQQARRFRVIAGTEIASLVIGIVTALVLALQGSGPWALIGQQLMFFSIRLILTLFYSPFRPLMVLNVRGVKSHLTFGMHLVLANIATWFTRSLDNLVIGKVLDAAAVGTYSMTYQFVRLPLIVVTGPLQAVLYPHFAQLKDNKTALRDTYLFFSRLLAILMFPAVGMLAAAHNAVFTLLLSEKWSTSGRLFMFLAPACALQAVTLLGATVRMSLGRTDAQLRAVLEFGAIWICLLLPSVRYGLGGVAVAYNCAVLAYAPRSVALVLPLIDCPARSYLQAIAWPAIVSLLASGVFWRCAGTFHLTNWAQLLLAIALAVVCIALSTFVQIRPLRTEYSASRWHVQRLGS